LIWATPADRAQNRHGTTTPPAGAKTGAAEGRIPEMKWTNPVRLGAPPAADRRGADRAGARA